MEKGINEHVFGYRDNYKIYSGKLNCVSKDYLSYLNSIKSSSIVKAVIKLINHNSLFIKTSDQIHT